MDDTYHNFQISHSSTVWGLLFIHMATAQNVSVPDPYLGRTGDPYP